MTRAQYAAQLRRMAATLNQDAAVRRERARGLQALAAAIAGEKPNEHLDNVDRLEIQLLIERGLPS